MSGNDESSNNRRRKRFRFAIGRTSQAKDRSPRRETHSRRPSGDQTLRYRLSIRPGGPQPSHSIKNLVRRSSDEEEKEIPHRPLPVVPSLTSVHSRPEREHNADFFNRLSPYFSTKESLLNVAKPFKPKLSWFRLHRTKKAEAEEVHRVSYHAERCKNCLELKSDCVCLMAQHSKESRLSDWSVLSQPVTQQPKRRAESRIDWLVELEAHSRVDRVRMLEEKFNERREVCCFPFNTFQIYSMSDIKEANFYLEH